MKVLIVDDAVAVQQSLGRLLGAIPGVEITGCADDVVGALSLIDAIRPDVVVLDANLRDGERGIDVLHYLRRHAPAAKVVALSNIESPSLRETYLEAGASRYFDKATEFIAARDWIAALAPSLAASTPAARR